MPDSVYPLSTGHQREEIRRTMRPMRIGHNLLIVLTLAFLSSPGISSAETRSDIQGWSAVLQTRRITDSERPVSLWLDTHARRSESNTLFIVRPGIGWAPLSWLSVWAGYGWIPTDADNGGVNHEHRFWQQLVLKHKTDNGFAFQARTRLEERLSEGGDDVGLRVREFLRASWQPDVSIPIGVAVWDELFVSFNDTDWGQRSGFDQNRLFIGPMLPVHPNFRIEMGYLFLYANREPDNRIGHVFATNLFVTM